MTRNSIHIVLFMLAALCYSNARAQDIAASDVVPQIKEYLEGLSYWRFQYSPEDTTFPIKPKPKDSIEKFNSRLIEYVQKVCGEVPAFMTANLDQLQTDEYEFPALTSDDKMLRIYNWETHLHSEGSYYNSAAQYKAGGGTKFAYIMDVPENAEKDGGALNTHIYTIRTKDNKTYYLVVYKNILAGKIFAAGVKALEIVGDELKGADIFVATNRTLNNIDYNYDYYSNYNYQTMKEDQVVHLSKNNKKLYIPLVEGDQMTGRWLVYVFDGSKFVYDKKAK